MRRYLIWSLAFHAVLLFIGAVVAPLRGFSGSSRPDVVISVGLVDFADPGKVKGSAPKPVIPEPAKDELIAKDPAVKDDLAEIKVPEKPKKDDKKKETDSKKTTDRLAKRDTTKTAPPALAVNDTGGISVGINNQDGSEGGDVWGVEAGGNTHPYFRQGGALIRQNWRNPGYGRQSLACIVRFTVRRSGEIVDVVLEEKSGVDLFDRSALRAVQVTESWPAFPSIWDQDEQTIHLRFEHRP